MEMRERAAIVTGGASGIGRGVAHELVRRGAYVLVADVDGDGAARVAAEIGAAGDAAVGRQVDVVADDAFTSLREATHQAFGRIDLVMNNVGVLTRGLPDHLSLAEWRRVLEINLFSVVRNHAEFVPFFLERGSGHIVNTASLAGLFTYAYDRQPYAAPQGRDRPDHGGAATLPRAAGYRRDSVVPQARPHQHLGGCSHVRAGDGDQVAGAAYSVRAPEEFAPRVADAIEENWFMVHTDDAVVDELVARASDWNGFLARKIAEVSEA